MILPLTFNGQNLTSSVISTAGDYYSSNNNSLSITIGELVADNYTSELYKLNAGFQQGIGNKYISLTFFLEGFFNGVNMNQVNNGIGAVYPVGFTDKYQLQIRKNTIPYSLLYADTSAMVKTDGKSCVKLPAWLTGNNFIVIKHRNHIETWSSAPLSFTADTTYYNFTTSADKAFGNNLKLIENMNIINSPTIKTSNNITELKSFSYNPQRFSIFIFPESDNIHLKVIVIDKILNKTYQKTVLKADYLYQNF